MTNEDLQARLARAVADGTPVDWDAEIADAPPDCRTLVESLRDISTLARPGVPVMAPVAAGGYPDDVLPASWGPFEILAHAGDGAHGTVFRARDTRLDRMVAVKLLPADPSADRVVEEARALARVRHPNVVAVFGADVVDGRPGLWMEFIAGRTNHDIVSRDGPLRLEDVLLVGIDVCHALAAVHAAGLVHRDVSARNVMREVGGRVVLLDLGAGRSLDLDGPTGSLAGSPYYLAPELLETPARGSTSADIYAAGVLVSFLLTGRYPVEGATVTDLRAAHAARRHRGLRDARHDVPPMAAKAIEKAVAPEPSARYRTAAEFSAALSEVLGLLHAVGGSPGPRAGRSATTVA